MTYHLVIVDGGKRSGIAYGSFKVYDPNGNDICHVPFVLGDYTSNQSEYLSLYKALTWCLEHGILNVSVLMDSKLVVYQVNGLWICENEHIKPLLERVLKIIRMFDSFNLQHISNKYIKQKLGH